MLLVRSFVRSRVFFAASKRVMPQKATVQHNARLYGVLLPRLPHKASEEFSGMRVAHNGALEARRKLLMHAQPSWLRVVPVTDKLA